MDIAKDTSQPTSKGAPPMNNQQTTHQVHAPVTRQWNFSVPPQSLRNKRIRLLTIGRVSIFGVWGEQRLGEHFTAWIDEEEALA